MVKRVVESKWFAVAALVAFAAASAWSAWWVDA